MRRYRERSGVNGPESAWDYKTTMMIRTTLTILAVGALCAAGTSLASAQSYPASQQGAGYSPTQEG
jgi:hypothetical protein